MDLFSSVPASVSAFFATDPNILAVQLLLACIAFFLVFLVLYVTRDVILRTHSLAYQIGCILLTALLPFIGFFLYLLVRPSQTLSERLLHRKLSELLSRMPAMKKIEHKQEKGGQKKLA